MNFTTSWDDGHPMDLRLAEVLNRHGFEGTFYVPCNNREGLPVLSPSQLRDIDGRFELGSHTHDHCYLNTVATGAARMQIREGRTSLEDILGHRVDGFCYPGGRFARVHRAMVEEEGFRFARTTSNLCLDKGTHAFERPTTFQLYPHSGFVYLRNWIRHGRWLHRSKLARMSLSSPDLLSLLKQSLLLSLGHEGIFHIWGHSWELDLFDGWRLLEEFLTFASDHVDLSDRVANGTVLGSMSGLPAASHASSTHP